MLNALIVSIALLTGAIAALMYFWILAPRRRPGTSLDRRPAYETAQTHPWTSGRSDNRRDLR